MREKERMRERERRERRERDRERERELEKEDNNKIVVCMIGCLEEMNSPNSLTPLYMSTIASSQRWHGPLLHRPPTCEQQVEPLWLW